jgi:hypothetical protein
VICLRAAPRLSERFWGVQAIESAVERVYDVLSRVPVVFAFEVQTVIETVQIESSLVSRTRLKSSVVV